MKRGVPVLCSAFLTFAALACQDLAAPLKALFPGPSSPYLNASGRVVVYPDSMRGWTFYNDQQSVACTDASVCRMVVGPGAAPSGSGSAELATGSTSEGKALILVDYKGVRLDQITTLSFATYRQSADPGNNLAIALQLNVDYDLADGATGYQGRLVYEPYHIAAGTVSQGTWQDWDTKAGKWWGTKATVSKNGVNAPNACVQSAPCTWAQLLAAFPNLGIHNTYGALVLKAGSGWASFRGNVDNLRIAVAGTSTTFDFERSGPTGAVSATAPDSVPKALWDSLTVVGNLMANPPGLRGTWIRNVVLIAFRPATSQSERQVVLDGIEGVPLGGVVGFHVVRIPYALAPGDSASGPALRAVRKLRGSPAVEDVTLFPVMEGFVNNFRRPKDGNGFRNWPLSRDSLRSANWAQVAVNAPFAWGCTTGPVSGEATPNISIVDNGFHDVNDLRGNLGSVREFTASSDTNSHGTGIAGIVGAVGENDAGIAGMLWSAKINLYDTKRPGTTTQQTALWTENTLRAVKAGAKVVNISWAINPAVFGGLTPRSTPESEELLRLMESYMRRVLEASRDSSTGRLGTLFVVAAGDLNTDARWGGWAHLAEDPRYRDNMIVVGATVRAGANGQVLNPSSNTGRLDIVAPGYAVTSLARNDSTAIFDGSSFAAPFVTGAAGMMLTFDPGLPVDSLKYYLLRGAALDPRSVQSLTGGVIPVLNAYGSLSAVAERRGAPLCGNRVWNDGTNKIVAQRGAVTEVLIDGWTMDDYVANVHTYHGGKRIDLGFSYEYNWNPTQRRFQKASALTSPPAGQESGAWLSYHYNSDHDNRSWVARRDTFDVAGSQVILQLYDTTGQLSSVQPDPFHVPGSQRPPMPPVCIMHVPISKYFTGDPTLDPDIEFSVAVSAKDFGYFHCVGTAYEGTWTNAPSIFENGSRNNVPLVASMAPQGDYVYVPISLRRREVRWDPLNLCNANDHYWLVDSLHIGDPGFPYQIRRCSHYATNVDSAVAASVWRVDVRSGVWSQVPLAPVGLSPSRADREINWLAVSEDGKELIASFTRRVGRQTAPLLTDCHDEVIEWIALEGTAATHIEGQVLHQVRLPQGAACGGWTDGGGTVSPARAGRSGAVSRAKSTKQPRPFRSRDVHRVRLKP